jgi:hypothetical protein
MSKKDFLTAFFEFFAAAVSMFKQIYHNLNNYEHEVDFLRRMREE